MIEFSSGFYFKAILGVAKFTALREKELFLKVLINKSTYSVLKSSSVKIFKSSLIDSRSSISIIVSFVTETAGATL